MAFLKFHQKGKPILILSKCIEIVLPDIKGRGSVIMTDMDERSFAVDEAVEEIESLLMDAEIDVDLLANDG